MTNFHIIPTKFNSDDTVYTPVTQDETHNAVLTNNITNEHAAGFERYNTIVENYDSLDDKDAMVNMMTQKITYVNTYQPENQWCSEYCGFLGLKPDTPADKFQKILQAGHEEYLSRKRSEGKVGTWHTTHSTIYDLKNLKMYVYDSSEDLVPHEFSL